MKKVFAIAIASGALLTVVAAAQEKKITQQDLPAAVQQAIKAEVSQGATVRGFATEVENGKKLYEAELTVNGHARDITFDEQGKVVAMEEETTLAKIPAPAAAAIQKAAAGGKITTVETVIESGKTAYEAQITKGQQKSEIKVDARGRVVK